MSSGKRRTKRDVFKELILRCIVLASSYPRSQEDGTKIRRRDQVTTFVFFVHVVQIRDLSNNGCESFLHT